jgi:hypothetical protein
MLAIKGWEQTGVFDPTNPNQRIREIGIGWPQSWASYYWNRTADAGTLKGLGRQLAGWDSIPGWGQVGLVLAVSALAGHWLMGKYGDKYIKPTVKKIPIVGGMLSGLRRRGR